MSLPNDSILVTPGSGATVATHVVNSKEYQAVVPCDASGHIQGSKPTYSGQSGFTALAANKLFFDLFNASGSGVILRLVAISLQKDMSTQTGTNVRFDLFRTTSVGTGGTTITHNKNDTNDASLPAQVTARTGATGGATQTDLFLSRFYHSEETNVAAQAQEAFPFWPPGGISLWMPVDLTARENYGFTLKQITSTTAGVYNAWYMFTVE
jgi:hypothetical protein